MNILEELKKRDILNNITNLEKFKKLPLNSKIYIGFDPTAQSLHLGNYVQISQLLRFKQFGYQPIAVIGGATGMIGDPSGRSSERKLLDNKILIANKKAITKQLNNFGIETIDNLKFYQNFNILDFLREAGKLININYMLNKESVASRLEQGLSFTEFAYQLIQGWDFKCLYQEHQVYLQLGGSDQWGNITTGIELIRKTKGEENLAVGITSNLLTTTSGDKFGKSAGNALWLDANLTSSYQLYQYLLNTSDQDVEKLLKWLTFLDLNKIDKIIKEHKQKPFLRYAQKQLAFTLVKDIHSLELASQAEKLSQTLFGKGDLKILAAKDLMLLDQAIPTIETKEKDLLTVMVTVKAAQSKREAREFINNNSILLNGVLVKDTTFQLAQKMNLLRRGKKNYFLIKLKEN